MSLYNKRTFEKLASELEEDTVLIRVTAANKMFPSDDELEISELLYNKKNIAYCMIDYDLEKYNFVQDINRIILEEVDLDGYFSEDGIIASKLKSFEYRKEQEAMAMLVKKSLNQDIKAIIEAGTGTGKTLAYLLPSVLWSIKNKKKIVIATNTINLQEQLLNKDLPMLKKIIPDNFSYALIKGRNNYLCNRLFYENIFGKNFNIDNFSQEQRDQIDYINKWGLATDTGDKSELPFEVSYDIWEMIQSSSELCLGKKCKHRENCYFLRARKEKNKANVIVANHHLFFADLNIRAATDFDAEYLILPRYDALIFDEAHNIESVGRNYFSIEISKLSFVKLLNRIYSKNERRRKQKSVLTRVEEEFSKKKLKSDETYINCIVNIKAFYDILLSAANSYFDNLMLHYHKGEESEIKKTINADEMLHSPFFNNIRKSRDEFQESMLNFSKLLKDFYDIIKKEDQDNIEVYSFEKYINLFKNFMDSFNQIQSFSENNYVYWLTINSLKNNIIMTASPLDIEYNMSSSLYENLNRIVFTSATISAGGNFEYFKDSIGLNYENTIEKIIKSPFNYDEQMKVYLPNDLVATNGIEYIKEISSFLLDVLLKVNGKAFVLFTSYSTLNQIYYNIHHKLLSNGLEVFLHGTKPRSMLVKDFKEARNPILFGTTSFWEGVDVQGENLSTVIIVKLPFLVPTEPIVAAKSTKFEKEGKNSFYEYQIPEAVIKFKQGIGRLIRRKDDRGNILILDDRIIKKSYGSYFKEAIPTKKINVLRKKEIIELID